jgi:hypothetical protein
LEREARALSVFLALFFDFSEHALSPPVQGFPFGGIAERWGIDAKAAAPSRPPTPAFTEN